MQRGLDLDGDEPAAAVEGQEIEAPTTGKRELGERDEAMGSEQPLDPAADVLGAQHTPPMTRP